LIEFNDFFFKKSPKKNKINKIKNKKLNEKHVQIKKNLKNNKRGIP